MYTTTTCKALIFSHFFLNFLYFFRVDESIICIIHIFQRSQYILILINVFFPLNLINIQQEILTWLKNKKKKLSLLFIDILDVEITTCRYSLRSVNPHKLPATFFADRPIILDGVDKMRDRRIARWKRPCSMALYRILTKKNVQKESRLNPDTLAVAKKILRKLRKE